MSFLFLAFPATAQLSLDLSGRASISTHLVLTIVNHRYLVGATTVWSGVSYIYTKDAVKILNAGIRKQKSGKF